MKSKHTSLLFLSFIIFLSSFLLSGCGMKELNSNWRDHEVTLDGIDDGPEWEGTRYFFNEEKVTIGLLNDNKNLYIRLSSRDQRLQAQLVMVGFTIWFDAKGGKKKTVGIHFPIGMQSGGIETMRVSGRTSMKKNPDRLMKMLEEAQKEIEIFGPGKGECCTLSIPEVEELGIKAKIDNSKGNLVYELKVPLARNESQPYGIGTDTSGTISIGFEMGEMDMKQMTREPRGQRGGMGGGRTGGRGDMGGIGSRGGGRGMGGGMRQMPESLELWLKIRLAAETKSIEL